MASKLAVVQVARNTRFEAARREAATRAGLTVAANVLEEAERRVGRARALVQQAISMDAPQRATAMHQAELSLREAVDELRLVLEEV